MLTTPLSFQIPPDLAERLDRLAKQLSLSKSALVRRAIEAGLPLLGPDTPPDLAALAERVAALEALVLAQE